MRVSLPRRSASRRHSAPPEAPGRRERITSTPVGFCAADSVQSQRRMTWHRRHDSATHVGVGQLLLSIRRHGRQVGVDGRQRRLLPRACKVSTAHRSQKPLLHAAGLWHAPRGCRCRSCARTPCAPPPRRAQRPAAPRAGRQGHALQQRRRHAATARAQRRVPRRRASRAPMPHRAAPPAASARALGARGAQPRRRGKRARRRERRRERPRGEPGDA